MRQGEMQYNNNVTDKSSLCFVANSEERVRDSGNYAQRRVDVGYYIFLTERNTKTHYTILI